MGGAIGGIGTYLFLTEKSAATRKQIANQFSDIPKEELVNRNTFSQPLRESRISYDAGSIEENVDTNAETGAVSKAQKVVSHLKHKY